MALPWSGTLKGQSERKKNNKGRIQKYKERKNDYTKVILKQQSVCLPLMRQRSKWFQD
jgi:hypothetical protein